MKVFVGILLGGALVGGLCWFLVMRQKDDKIYIHQHQEIAFFDPNLVWASVPYFQEPKKELEAVLSRIQTDYATLDAELRHESHALQEKRRMLQEREHQGTLGSKKGHEALAKDLESRWNDFDKKVLSIQKTVEAKKMCIGTAYENVNKELHDLLGKTVQSIAEKHSLKMVLSKDVVVFSNPGLDLTDEIIAALNAVKTKTCLDLKKCA